MSITVRGYSKHLDGKLVTVHGYAASRNQAGEVTPMAGRTISKQLVSRGQAMGMSPPGMYMNPADSPPLAGEGGLTAYSLLPGGHATKQPIVRWRRSILPIAGAYKTPKRG